MILRQRINLCGQSFENNKLYPFMTSLTPNWGERPQIYICSATGVRNLKTFILNNFETENQFVWSKFRK